jgi:tetratricopeptide (TPR) repeat protein
LLSALSLLQVRKWQDPARLWEETLQAYPDSMRATFFVANRRMAEGRWPEAERLFRRCVESDKGAQRARFNLGFVLVHEKRWPEAEEVFRGLAREGFQNPKVWYYLGLANYFEGRYRPAIAYLSRVKWNPTDPMAEAVDREIRESALLYRGLAEAGVGDFKTAEGTWKRLLKVNENHKKGLFNLAVVNGRLGREDEARRYSERFVALCPGCPEAAALRSLWKH